MSCKLGLLRVNKFITFIIIVFIVSIGKSPKEVITSYTSYSGRMKSLPDWLNKGAVVGMQGGTDAVLQVLSQIKQVVGSADDIASFWLQDWTGQRNFTSSARDIKRVGLWWNWEVSIQKSFLKVIL